MSTKEKFKKDIENFKNKANYYVSRGLYQKLILFLGFLVILFLGGFVWMQFLPSFLGEESEQRRIFSFAILFGIMLSAGMLYRLLIAQNSSFQVLSGIRNLVSQRSGSSQASNQASSNINSGSSQASNQASSNTNLSEEEENQNEEGTENSVDDPQSGDGSDPSHGGGEQSGSEGTPSSNQTNSGTGFNQSQEEDDDNDNNYFIEESEEEDDKTEEQQILLLSSEEDPLFAIKEAAKIESSEGRNLDKIFKKDGGMGKVDQRFTTTARLVEAYLTGASAAFKKNGAYLLQALDQDIEMGKKNFSDALVVSAILYHCRGKSIRGIENPTTEGILEVLSRDLPSYSSACQTLYNKRVAFFGGNMREGFPELFQRSRGEILSNIAERISEAKKKEQSQQVTQ